MIFKEDQKMSNEKAAAEKKAGGPKLIGEDIGSFKEYMANVQAAKKRQKDKQETRKAKDATYVDRLRKGIKFYDKKGSGRLVKGKKVYDK